MGKIESRRRKGWQEDERVEWHHWLDGHEFEQALGVGDGKGSLECCSPWGCRESDTTEWPNWTEPCNLWYHFLLYLSALAAAGKHWLCTAKHFQVLTERLNSIISFLSAETIITKKLYKVHQSTCRWSFLQLVLSFGPAGCCLSSKVIY